MSAPTAVAAHRALHRALPLAAVVALVALARGLAPDLTSGDDQSPVVAVGLLLIGGFIGGKAAAAMRLPRITGYIVVGVLIGPHVSGVVDREMLRASAAIEGLAVALIALTAGGELRIGWVRRHLERLMFVTYAPLVLVLLSVTAVVFFGRGLFPFVPDHDLATAAVIAAVFGAIAASNSPMVTIAIIAETRSEGPVARTALGATVLTDLTIIVLFAVTLSLARDALGQGDDASLAGTLARELLGSISAGALFGIAIGGFLRFIGRDVPVFIFAACLAMWQISEALHLETLLVALTAGFWVENFARAGGDALIKGIERVSLPIYALFFAAAGTKVDLGALATLWPVALLLSTTRAAAIFGGARLGATLAGAEPEVKRYVWMGLISQAGMSLALATIIARTFPEWGDAVQALIVAMIALHELIGPIAFQWALGRASELGRAAPPPPRPPPRDDREHRPLPHVE